MVPQPSPSPSPLHRITGLALAMAWLALPWLNPFTFGPTPAIGQGLVVWLGAGFYLQWAEGAGVGREARVRTLALAWWLAATLSAVIGLLQYFGLVDALSPWVNGVAPGQAYANLRQRNQLATLLAIGISVWLWGPRCTPAAPGPAAGAALPQGTPWAAWIAWIAASVGALAACVMVAADAATGSRTGLLQLLALLGLACIWRRARRQALLAVLAYAVAAVLLPWMASLDTMQSGILGRVSEAPAGCASRAVLWSNVLHLIAQRPWLGWGWGELKYAHFITPYPGERFCEILGNAHNLPLHLAVELGLPLALGVCSAVGWAVLRARPWRETDATRQLAWAVLAVIGLHSLLEYPLWYGPFQWATVVAVWMLWPSRPKLARPALAHALGSLKQVLPACLLAACSYIAWDYWRISQIYLQPPQRAAAYREDTLAKLQASWLFRTQVQFAELGTTTLTADNAEQVYALGREMLHFSPEPSVLEKTIESARMRGHADEAAALAERYAAAYPQDHARWAQARLGRVGDKAP